MRRWWRRRTKILASLFSAIGTSWLLIEVFSYGSNGTIDPFLRNIPSMVTVFAFALFISLLVNRPRKVLTHRLRGKDNRIRVEVGDAFKNTGALVVPVNDQFDMNLNGNVLRTNSIQSQLIKRYYAGKIEHINTDLSKVVQLGSQYNVGKTIEIEQKNKKFYLVVNSRKQQNDRVKSEMGDLAVALNGLWEYIASDSSRDDTVTIPIINTQHGRDSSLTRMDAVKEIIDSYVESSKGLDICGELIISIKESDIGDGLIDLDEVDDFLRARTRFYRQLSLAERTEDADQSSKSV